MKFIFIILILTIILSGFSQLKDDYLLKVWKGNYDELGVECGYVNLNGDTVIPIGKYYYCYTDTLRNFAIVIKKEGKLIGIDRNENELFEVHWFDNGPDYVKEGLFRIKKNGKIGYSDTNGIIVIEPQFDCAFPFENGKAKVSNDCKTVPSGEHSEWISENWKYINKKGQTIEE
ncbi:MAG: WG repeat-containing protein [Candidatus Kapabacteria bacterium]|nr:WG repeat-containing protein [Candidatus Kapabacteria bacterium]